ncbi:MAG: methionyl-tRNA formyltransferase [Candidatus Saccharibacteria bacterium]|nr:methionyl-tRNA formyltransferase [Candidatus Saccharibacteria bacterium]
MSQTIVFFGNERLATGVTTNAYTLHSLIKAGYHIAAVVTNYEEARSRSSRTLEIAELAKEHNIPVIIPDKLADIKEQLMGYNAVAGVLVAFGKIVPQSIIDIFPRGIINIHPSLLPLHRGPVPLESVIREGASETGVSLMSLAKEMDAGPVYAQEKLGLAGTESKQLLADVLLGRGAEMLIKHLPAILEGTLVPAPQDDSKATYDSLIKKEDGIIDWNKSAKEIEQEFRAYYGWPRSRATLAGKEVILTAVTVSDKVGAPGTVSTQDKQLLVYCRYGAINVERLQPAGKNEMTAEAFIAGHKHLF